MKKCPNCGAVLEVWQEVFQNDLDKGKHICNEKCPEARNSIVYDWCKLSNNICIRNTGNSIFDIPCDYYNGLEAE